MTPDAILRLARKIPAAPPLVLWPDDDSTAESSDPAVEAAPGGRLVVTELLPAVDALRFYRAACDTAHRHGLSPLLLSNDALSVDRCEPGTRTTPSAEDFFAQRARGADDQDLALDQLFDDALTNLGDIAGCDPLSVLHRIALDDLAALADDSDLEFDDLLLSPDDPDAAYREALANRAAFLESVAGRGLALVSPIRAPNRDAALTELGREGPYRVCLARGTPAQALAQVGFGGFNECPLPEEHAAVWEYWHRLYGAEPVMIGADSIGSVFSRPVQDRESLVRFAREVALYDADALIEGPLPLLGTLYRNASVAFWWD